jgi:hypothetical protein
MGSGQYVGMMVDGDGDHADSASNHAPAPPAPAPPGGAGAVEELKGGSMHTIELDTSIKGGAAVLEVAGI